MTCYHPLGGFRSPGGSWSPSFFIGGEYMEVPCGGCHGCRLERSRQWAVRLSHEAQLHGENSFVTLTYRDADLPPYGSLRKPDFVKFMKRLRKRYAPKRIRFFQCGEYGDKLQRPHHHAALFGHDFPDKRFHRMRNGYRVYRSAELERLWPYGFSEIGSVTYQSAGYIARYIFKKVNGKGAVDHYTSVDESTGEIITLEPEYITMSRNPGLGSGWYDRFGGDVYPSDEVIVGGRKQKPPRYYDKKLQESDPELLEEIKAARKGAIDLDEQSTERLQVRETCSLYRTRRLKRELDDAENLHGL